MKSEVFNMDCMELMARYEDKYFDLAVVDPEYGISINHNMGRRKGDKPSDFKRVTWDDESVSKKVLDEIIRVSKNQIIWGANHFISKMPFDSSCWIIWDKLFSDEVSFAQFEMAWTSFEGTCKKFTKHPSQQNRIHPTQKPIPLYSWIYSKFLPGGGKVLDTHLGSGSNRIAADKAGNIDFTAAEIDTDYFNAQEIRFKNYKSQLVMQL